MEYVTAPASAKWLGATPKRTIDMLETPTQIAKNTDVAKDMLILDKDLHKNTYVYNERVAAAGKLFAGLDRMSEFALKKETYSTLMNVFGTVSRGVKNEIAGFKFVFAGDGVTEEQAKEADSLNIRNEDGTVNIANAKNVMNTLDAKIEAIEGITNKAERISRQREMMETMALRLAIAEVVTDGDARPSDFDVQARMRNYLATSAPSFIEKKRI